MREKILIIEDDPTLQQVLRDNFELDGREVRVAADGEKALGEAFDFKPDLIILDIMLPRLNGFEICRRARKKGLATPIIMLTAKGQESDIIRGLNEGADDYVTKPFSLEVLLARTNACLRRGNPPAAEGFAFGEHRLDTRAHKLFRGSAEIPLTPKEFRLLEYFLRNMGRAFTREKLLDAVWGQDLIVTPRSVDRCVNTLRLKVERDPEHPKFIRTIRDVGYRFDGPIGPCAETEGSDKAER